MYNSHFDCKNQMFHADVIVALSTEGKIQQMIAGFVYKDLHTFDLNLVLRRHNNICTIMLMPCHNMIYVRIYRISLCHNSVTFQTQAMQALITELKLFLIK